MRRFLAFIVFVYLFSPIDNIAQIIDINYSNLKGVNAITDTVKKESKDIELLSRGFMDIFSNGKMQSTAQILKINIGEKDGFYFPFFLLLGASGDGLGEQELNENTIANLLNPLGGIINGSFNGKNNLLSSESGITSLNLAYQISGKLINAQDSLSGNSKFLGVGYGNIGLFFQTGAWDPDDAGNMGVFWVQVKAAGSLAFDNAVIKEVFGNSVIDSYFIGYSIDLGIEIDKKINLKAGIYQYLNSQDIILMKDPVFKFSLDYNLEND